MVWHWFFSFFFCLKNIASLNIVHDHLSVWAANFSQQRFFIILRLLLMFWQMLQKIFFVTKQIWSYACFILKKKMTFTPFILIRCQDHTLNPNTCFESNIYVAMCYIKVENIVGLNCFLSRIFQGKSLFKFFIENSGTDPTKKIFLNQINVHLCLFYSEEKNYFYTIHFNWVKRSHSKAVCMFSNQYMCYYVLN